MKPLVWMRAIRDVDLSATAKQTAWAIGLRADLNGTAQLKYEKIAGDSGLSESTVKRRVDELASDGWLHVVKRHNGHGQQANSYRLMMPVDNLSQSVTVTPTRVSHVPTQSVTVTRRVGVTVTPISEGLKEVSENGERQPVDNSHLAAVVSLMAGQHRMPR